MIPSELGRLTNLDWLNLSGNQMQGTIPDSLQGLTKFRRLSLENNSFEGEIPAWLGNFPRLRDLSRSTRITFGAAFQPRSATSPLCMIYT